MRVPPSSAFPNSIDDARSAIIDHIGQRPIAVDVTPWRSCGAPAECSYEALLFSYGYPPGNCRWMQVVGRTALPGLRPP